MTTLKERLGELNQRKSDLNKEFDAMRDEALAECIGYIELFGFTAAELKLKTVAEKKVKGVVPPKYKNPFGSETWSGRGGRKPNWFKAALAQGLTEEDMLIK